MPDFSRVQRIMGRSTRLLTTANVILSLLFALILLAAQLWPRDLSSTATTSDSDIAKRTHQAAITQAAVDRVITGKALFRTSGAIEEKVVDELGHYELKGVSNRGGRTRAYIRDTKLKKMLVKNVGDTLGQYEIVDITDRGVAVKKGAETLMLTKG